MVNQNFTLLLVPQGFSYVPNIILPLYTSLQHHRRNSSRIIKYPGIGWFLSQETCGYSSDGKCCITMNLQHYITIQLSFVFNNVTNWVHWGLMPPPAATGKNVCWYCIALPFTTFFLFVCFFFSFDSMINNKPSCVECQKCPTSFVWNEEIDKIIVAAIVVTSFAVSRGQKCTAGGNMELTRAIQWTKSIFSEISLVERFP